MSQSMGDPAGGDERIHALRRPHPRLLRYYLLFSLITGPAFPIVFAVLFMRFRTLRYRFDDEGVTMSWGALFKREISLTYSRIQDIHLRSNVVERWLGLSRLLVQTASGSARAEMKIEGVLELSAVRNFMYDRMRGARMAGATAAGRPAPAGAASSAAPAPVPGSGASSEGAEASALAGVLREIASEVVAIRTAIESGGVWGGERRDPP